MRLKALHAGGLVRGSKAAPEPSGDLHDSMAGALLQEPSKKAMLAYEAEGSAVPPRRAFCVLQAYPDASCIEGVVDLSHAKPSILAWEKVSKFAALSQIIWGMQNVEDT